MSNLLKQFHLNDNFLGAYEKLVVEQVIPYQEKALKDEIPEAEKSHAIENFRQAAKMLAEGICEEEFYGMVFQDSDVAKWLEAAAYSLVNHPDAELEQRADDIIALIGSAQQEDGYLNTYFTVKEPDKKWTNLQEAHELYCAGHFIEAAVAYYEATGKDSLLNIMKKNADHIYRRFVEEKAEGYPGHPEIELALMRLYDTTKEKKYLELAAHFINVRGVDPDYYKKEAETKGWTVWGMNPEDTEYAQNQAPVRELTKATGHSVRAVYLYTGMAHLAAETGDESLVRACETLWDNIVKQRMYITGGIGSTNQGEAFTKDYNLPNDTAYAETCASIGLMFFARRMLQMKKDSRYADEMERALYNTVLAGMQLDGKRFFYVNPLEVIPGISGEAVTHRHTLPQRPKWFGCACCPPNVARTLTSIAEYAWSETEEAVFSHLYVGGELDLTESKGVKIQVETGYPYDGNVNYRIVKDGKEKTELTLAIRLPGWCKQLSVSRNGGMVCQKNEDGWKVIAPGVHHQDGYLYISGTVGNEDVISVSMDMPVYRVYSNPAVASNNGRVALMRGPLVYCVEGVDNNGDVLGLSIAEGTILYSGYRPELLSGVVTLSVPGVRTKRTEELYLTEKPEQEPVNITAIPYYAWGNRGLNEMRVWMPEV
ncbi:MAG: glycoside hydrolase family 127 protein [Lachnospiraceae bacterium]|nr:glycoside hydrolase family 127 protein [Lachnospiraceae bacterium]